MELEVGHSYLVTDTFTNNHIADIKQNQVREIYVEAIRERHYQIQFVGGKLEWVLKEDFHRQFNIEDKLGKGPYTATITTD